MSLSPVEIALLTGRWGQIPAPLSPATVLAHAIVQCRFRDALTSPAARAIIVPGTGPTLADAFRIADGETEEDDLARVALAGACLQAFVQANWTGPDLDIAPLDLLAAAPGAWTAESLHAAAVAELASGGEPAYHLAAAPAFLRLAQLLIARPAPSCASAPWWALRIATVHLRVLDEPVGTAEDFRTPLMKLAESLDGKPALAGRLHLELGLREHALGQDRLAGEDFVRAARATGLRYALTGALGRRTKFQQRDLSQLVLLAESRLPLDEDDDDDTPPAGLPAAEEPAPASIPETLALNDDTLLEQTAFTASGPSAQGALAHLDPAAPPPLHTLDQCILLALCLNVRNTQPAHGLTAEQMMPYIDRVLAHPRAWPVHTTALLLRARLEATRTRTVERSALQLQALVDQMHAADAPAADRLRMASALPLPSRWEMEQELARRLMSIGVVKSALEVFVRLELWADAVQCYAALDAPAQGIALVRDLLAGRRAEADAVVARARPAGASAKQDAAREAKLWCLLGDLDAPDAAAHYTKAWEVSAHTSGRAMRALGGLHFARGEWADATRCLRAAVAINPLVVRAWFILGCACMRAEEWVGGRDAFARCVALDEEDAESWNNLASMYLRMGARKAVGAADDDDDDDEKEKTTAPAEEYDDLTGTGAVPFENKLLAFRALQRGLRSAYENWRMWANFAVVALDVGELAEAARAVGRVVEQTEGKAGVDVDVLDRLVDAVARGEPAPEPTDAAAPADPSDTTVAAATGLEGQDPNAGPALEKALFALFDRVLLPRVASPRVFHAYARLLVHARRWADALKAHLDAYRAGPAAALQRGDHPDGAAWADAVREVTEVVDVLAVLGPRVDGSRWRAQGRSVVRVFMARMRDAMEGADGWTELERLAEEMKAEEE
ncbi:hypothetical protein HYPSUDRAFT_174219 [Hypholoma sublateritium FD-334 SS-4]|uniref:Uncharacterized protein n=1 Tax=Hypholoma sublateritium (strain FD-334 SS-4) TaxID=945553 RepID=A0A0D2PMP3_HYPSF|nr:hypothetical protein HYPSUDRAFT_174219 [Hypholoma sublateritium FD-334 SS-4]